MTGTALTGERGSGFRPRRWGPSPRSGTQIASVLMPGRDGRLNRIDRERHAITVHEKSVHAFPKMRSRRLRLPSRFPSRKGSASSSASSEVGSASRSKSPG